MVGDIIVCTTENLTQQIGGMRVVDQNYYTFVVQLNRTCDYGSQDGSLSLSEGTYTSMVLTVASRSPKPKVRVRILVGVLNGTVAKLVKASD